MVLAQRDFIGRRELLVALGSAAETWPLAGRAQQSATSIPRVGWLVTGSAAEHRFSLAAGAAAEESIDFTTSAFR